MSIQQALLRTGLGEQLPQLERPAFGQPKGPRRGEPLDVAALRPEHGDALLAPQPPTDVPPVPSTALEPLTAPPHAPA